MTASIVYVLCTLTSAACAVLLARAYARSRERLLFWSSLCFVGLCANNAMLFVDIVMLPQIDLSVWRLIPALLGIAALVYGLVVEAE
ncbi:MAG TPA: DUF5985 family protein [Candidatus Baltobacteraceae bacterium]|nr:DUF5985 family protein [Candidatus Baltobacteraceae bacterium]